MDTPEILQRLVQWAHEGAEMLGAVDLERRRLRARADAAEEECERLHRQLQLLWSENRRLRSERADVEEAVTRAASAQLVHDVVEKLRDVRRSAPARRAA
jgi:hypothetical protein